MSVQLIYSEEWGRDLEEKHDAYMENLYQLLEEGEESIDITGTYFCGCSTCERRASWTFLLQEAVQSYRNGSLTIETSQGE